MYSHLLVATDGSSLSDKAVTHAIDLAKAIGARLTVFYASPDYRMPIYAEGLIFEQGTKREYAAAAKEEARAIVERVAKKAAAAGVECATALAIAEAPWEAILAAAEKEKCDAIVMASHGRRGLSALLLGSETAKVLTHSKLPVLVVR
jgi:nucleotide-binding universal stress UspA family protein